MSVFALALALLAAAPEAGTVASAPASETTTIEKAVVFDTRDPAELINIGIAYAQTGEEAKARAAFEAALACGEVVDIETADGSATDSRRLARKALRMLARGEFRADGARSAQLTRRDR